MNPDIADVTVWLESHINFERTGPGDQFKKANDPGRRLRHLNKLMEVMGDPHKQYPVIHITGTNGKTSISRIVTSLLMAQGLRVGTFTSPHLQAVNERIMVNGLPISDGDLAESLFAVQLAEPSLGDDKPSYFEIMTAAAFRWFADDVVDVAVVEVGVGGTWDSTNIINATVAVVSNVELDHLNYLGPTRESIAEHKAGIVKPESALVLGERDEKLYQTFADRQPKSIALVDRDFGLESNGIAVGGRILTVKTPKAHYEDLFIALHGAHQGENAAIALTAVEAFFEQPLSEEVVTEAFATVVSPGRLEVLKRRPLVVVDGAHNKAGATTLMRAVKDDFQAASSKVVVMGMLSPHKPQEMLEALEISSARLLITCQPDSPRALPADVIAAAAQEMGVTTVVIPNVARAVDEAIKMANEDELVLITGSLYVVGEARQALT